MRIAGNPIAFKIQDSGSVENPKVSFSVYSEEKISELDLQVEKLNEDQNAWNKTLKLKNKVCLITDCGGMQGPDVATEFQKEGAIIICVRENP